MFCIDSRSSGSYRFLLRFISLVCQAKVLDRLNLTESRVTDKVSQELFVIDLLNRGVDY